MSDRRSRSRSFDRHRRNRSRSRSHERTRGEGRYDKDRRRAANHHPEGNARTERENTDREQRENASKKSADFSSLMVGAMTGKPKREANNDVDFSKTGEQWGKQEENNEDNEPGPPKIKADFGLSGVLATDEVTGNMLNGVVLKFTEPADARAPPLKGKKWRFYVFKGDDIVETLHLHKQSAYLIGREKAVADIYLRHPSLSKQHAVLQYRARNFIDDKQPFATPKLEVLPYIMDLGSTNGTFLNKEKIETQRYYELREKDALAFGESSREFVVMTDATTSD